MKGPIEALLFDFGGTLDASGVAWKERFYAFYRDEGLDMTAKAFQTIFFFADDHALAANLEAELARRGPGANKAGTVNGWNKGDRGARVAARFLSEASAAFARNRPVLKTLRERLSSRRRVEFLRQSRSGVLPQRLGHGAPAFGASSDRRPAQAGSGWCRAWGILSA